MRRSPPNLILAWLALALAALVALRPSLAYAQPRVAPDAGPSCAAVERSLVECRDSTEEARKNASNAEQRAYDCKTELTSTAAKAQQSGEAAKTCQHEREKVEAERERLEGERERLEVIAGGANNASVWLGQLAAYQAGESDTFPRARTGNTALDKAVQRLARDGGGRAFHRRLLVEALKVVAPKAWGRLKERGPTELEAWFVATAPLDADIVAEAQRAPTAANAPEGAPLTAALHLVRAFQMTAGCSAGTDAKECVRARQLQQLLESTGSLVVRRRIQEIWATECTTISPDVTSGWIQDFPIAHGGSDASWKEIGDAVYAKLFACYLDDASEHLAYGTWLKSQLPAVVQLTSAQLHRVDAIKARWKDASREAACARAVRAMQTMAAPSTCAVPVGEFRAALDDWTSQSAALDDADVPLAMCSQYAQLLWEGKAASIDGSFARPPSLDEMVVAKDMPPTPMWRLRAHCEERRGAPTTFPEAIDSLARYGRFFGEGSDRAPYRVDAAKSKPFELVRYEASQGLEPWVSHLASGLSSCTAVGLDDARCKMCTTGAEAARYDCTLAGRLDESWSTKTRNAIMAVVGAVALLVFATWARRMRRARKTYATWSDDSATFFGGIGLVCRADRWRALLPSRLDALELVLPSDAAWERWGKRAAVVRAPPGTRVLERDVNHAAFVARRLGASVVLLEHDDEASPDLSAVRAILEWAAKGGSRAAQILPIGVSRVRWSKNAHDILDLVEESSLRGNPFELRGRIATSTQFFNRERLVSGLLAAAHAGHWTVVTGLRRFGKSSLALEVARRLPGAAAYVDISGFDHELEHGEDPGKTADAILRYVCLHLLESARARWPDVNGPALPREGESLDAAALTLWFRDLSRACRAASDRPAAFLVVLDEIEQALDVGPHRLHRALDVLAIVIGRLKSAVGDAAMPEGGAPITVFLTSAIHPLLWAPLRTLSQQSIMGSFPHVCVPCLEDDSATTMMRSLGARQGIRFSEPALAAIVEESHGVPLLLRRLGASILELYDAERARQGSLGAVEIGVEGTAEAIAREAREGSPLRTWIESEIAPANAVTGSLLRRLAREDTVSVDTLWTHAKRRIELEFARNGIADTLAPHELERRAEEAAHVIVQLLHESGLVLPHGDLTAPDGYSLPDGAIRRALRDKQSVSELPAATSE